MNKKAFTLAEVLITLAIIGVVAAMTIPTLLAKINTIVENNQKKVFEAKVLKGLNLTRTAGELNNTYSSTEDFLRNGLGKHLKITKICGPTEIRNCVPYDSILYTTSDNKEDSVDVKDIDTAEELSLKQEDGYKDIAAFVMGDGTVVISSYKLDCLVDEGKLSRDIGENECFAGIYDLNGSRKPNKMGKDLQPFNKASLNIRKGPVVLATVNEVKIISNPQVYDGILTSTYCDTSDSNSTNWTVKSEYSKYGITKCCKDALCQDSAQGDRWAAAMIACKDMGGRLPTRAELTKIAQELYNDTSISTNYQSGLTLDTSKIPEALSGLGSSWTNLWSSQESNNSGEVLKREFDSSHTRSDTYNMRWVSYNKAMCVVD